MAQNAEIASMWTFARGDEQIVVRCPNRVQIVISGNSDVIRHINFHSPYDRLEYQSALESHLLREGWSLTSFTTTGPGRQARRGWLSWIRPKQLFVRTPPR